MSFAFAGMTVDTLHVIPYNPRFLRLFEGV